MAVATFDTLKFANTLKAAGVPPQQAEAQAVAFAEVVQLNFKELATKEDVDRAAVAIQAGLDQLAKDLRRETVDTRDELKRAIADVVEQFTHKLEDVRRELKDEVQKVNARLDTFQAKHAGDMALIRWMLAAVITIGGGILVRLFFFRGM